MDSNGNNSSTISKDVLNKNLTLTTIDASEGISSMSGISAYVKEKILNQTSLLNKPDAKDHLNYKVEGNTYTITTDKYLDSTVVSSYGAKWFEDHLVLTFNDDSLLIKVDFLHQGYKDNNGKAEETPYSLSTQQFSATLTKGERVAAPSEQFPNPGNFFISSYTPYLYSNYQTVTSVFVGNVANVKIKDVEGIEGASFDSVTIESISDPTVADIDSTRTKLTFKKEAKGLVINTISRRKKVKGSITVDVKKNAAEKIEFYQGYGNTYYLPSSLIVPRQGESFSGYQGKINPTPSSVSLDLVATLDDETAADITIGTSNTFKILPKKAGNYKLTITDKNSGLKLEKDLTFYESTAESIASLLVTSQYAASSDFSDLSLSLKEGSKTEGNLSFTYDQKAIKASWKVDANGKLSLVEDLSKDPSYPISNITIDYNKKAFSVSFDAYDDYDNPLSVQFNFA